MKMFVVSPTFRQVTNTTCPTTKTLNNTDGVLTISREKKIPIWEECYKEQLSVTDRQKIFVCLLNLHILTFPDIPENTSAINSLKANNAPGPVLLKAYSMLSAQLL